MTPEARQLARARISAARARAARHQYLTDLAARHHVELPPMPIDPEASYGDALSRALNLLEDAGAVIDWTRIETPDPERPNR